MSVTNASGICITCLSNVQALEIEGMHFQICRLSILYVQYLAESWSHVMTAHLALEMATANTVAVGGFWNLVGSKQQR